MTTLTEFLLARIAEDEALVESDQDHFGMTNDPRDKWIVKYSERMAAECAAKRRIVALHRPDGGDEDFPLCRRCHDSGPEAQGYPCDTLRLLATVYASHPDYDETWRP